MTERIPTKWHTWTDPKTGEVKTRVTRWITPEGQAEKERREQQKKKAYQRIKDRSEKQENKETGEKTIVMSPKDYNRAMELQQEIKEAEADKERIIRERAEAERIENLQTQSVTVQHEPLAKVGDASGPYLKKDPVTGDLKLMNYNPPAQLKKREETDGQRMERMRQEYYDKGGTGEPDIGTVEATVSYNPPFVETVIKKTPHVFPEQINPETGLPFSEKVFGPTPDKKIITTSHLAVAKLNQAMDWIEDVSGGFIEFDQELLGPSLSWGKQVVVRTEEGIYPTNVYTPSVDASNIFDIAKTFSEGRLALIEGPKVTARSEITNYVGGFSSNIEKKMHFVTGQPQAMTVMESQPEMGASMEAGLGYWSAELGSWIIAGALIGAGARAIHRGKVVAGRGVGKIQQDIVQKAIDSGVDYTNFLSPAGSGPPVGSGGEVVNVIVNPAINILRNLNPGLSAGIGIGVGAVSVGAGASDVVTILDTPRIYEKRTRTEVRRELVHIPGDITLPTSPEEAWEKAWEDEKKHKKSYGPENVYIDDGEFIVEDDTDHRTGFIVDEIIIDKSIGQGHGIGNINEITDELGQGIGHQDELIDINEKIDVNEIIDINENMIIDQNENVYDYEFVNEFGDGFETSLEIDYRLPGFSFSIPELPSPIFPKLGKLSGKFPSKNKRLYQPSLYALVKGIKKTGRIPRSRKKWSGIEMRPIIVSEKKRPKFMVRKSDFGMGKKRVLTKMPKRRTMIKVPTKMPRLNVSIPKKKKKQKIPGMKTLRTKIPKFKIPKIRKPKKRRIKI